MSRSVTHTLGRSSITAPRTVSEIRKERRAEEIENRDFLRANTESIRADIRAEETAAMKLAHAITKGQFEDEREKMYALQMFNKQQREEAKMAREEEKAAKKLARTLKKGGKKIGKKGTKKGGKKGAKKGTKKGGRKSNKKTRKFRR